MERMTAKKVLFFIKTFVLVTLLTAALSANAHSHRYHKSGCKGKPVFFTTGCYKPVNLKCKRVVYYYGPTRDCFYCGTDCSVMKWVSCHWDPYGNYVPGRWVIVNR